MLEQIGRIVRAARERAGLSADALAARAADPGTCIAALELGQAGMTTTQLDRVARALSLVPAALLRGREEVLDEPSVFLRHSSVMDFDDRDLAQLDAALDQGRLAVELGALTGEAPGLWRSGAFDPRAAGGDRPESAAHEGYALARAVRRELGTTKAPLGDLRELLESRFDIAVVVLALESTRVTALAIRDGRGAAVVLNDRDPERAANPTLARVHLAHELCHLLFDPSPGGLHLVVDVVSDRRDVRAEQRARAFAAELLIPQEGATDLLGVPKGTADAALAENYIAKARERFRTPYELAANHLANLGFIAQELRAWLVAGDRRTAPPVVETTRLPTPGGPSLLVTHRVRRAHEAQLITDGEARNALGIDPLAPLAWDP
ncbi:MAG: ImmA/IrrE family metallo-endopeptidase [Myxococcales bacterium]|nr:ImmA/IrrE family metallo-endopeptidase [Myxococcales bacterium]